MLTQLSETMQYILPIISTHGTNVNSESTELCKSIMLINNYLNTKKS